MQIHRKVKNSSILTTSTAFDGLSDKDALDLAGEGEAPKNHF